MKLLLVLGADDPARRALAAELAARGHAVVVLVGARSPDGVTRIAAEEAEPVRTLRLERGDLEPGHWQKTAAPAAAKLVREFLRAERPDVLLVASWALLTRELVHLAALARIPAVVAVADDWIACPIATRVRTDTGAPCDAVVGVIPCVACAARVPPATPWVPKEAQFLALAERQRDLERELALARAVLAPTAEHAERTRRFLGAAGARLVLEVVDPSDPVAHEALLARAVAAGAPSVTTPSDDWFGERMRAFAVEQWDAALRAAGGGSKA
ncbi:MAG: glycosyltransferase [Planctomycetota bacterium]